MQETDIIETRKSFIEYLKSKGLSNNTLKSYMFYYDKFDIGKASKKEYVGLFLQRYKNNSICRSFLMNLKEHLDLNDLKLPKITGRKERRLIKWLSYEEVKLVEEAMNKERNRIMVALSFQCGLRLNELLNIKKDDFFISDWMKNPKRSCNLLISGSTSKSKSDRIVFVKPLLMCRIMEYLLSIRRKIRPDSPMFKIKRTRWQKLVEIAGYKALNKRINPHMFRHSLATHLLNKGMDITKIKDILGHKSIATTQVYIHLSKEGLKEEFEEVF